MLMLINSFPICVIYNKSLTLKGSMDHYLQQKVRKQDIGTPAVAAIKD